MLALQEELTSTENKVAFARQAFNDAVMSYNTQREVFPNSRDRRVRRDSLRPNSSRSSRPRNARHPRSSSDPDWRQTRRGRRAIR